MIVKPVLAGALALVLSPYDIDFGVTVPFEHPYVERLTCNGGTGTGFKISDGRWVTVDHVSRIGGCTMDGKPITVTHNDPNGDFATFAVDDQRKGGIEVNCSGFRDRQWYFGIGYGRGISQIKSVRHSVLFSLMSGTPFAVFEANRFVPGMSGGPVLDLSGRVVGTVNAYGIIQRISFSRDLSRTILCSAQA